MEAVNQGLQIVSLEYHNKVKRTIGTPLNI